MKYLSVCLMSNQEFQSITNNTCIKHYYRFKINDGSPLNNIESN